MWRNVITRWKRGEWRKSRKRRREKRRAVETVTKPLLWYTYISVTLEDEVESTLITGWRTRTEFAFAAVECYRFVGAYRESIRAWRCRPPPTDSCMEISTLFRLQFHVASSVGVTIFVDVESYPSPLTVSTYTNRIETSSGSTRTWNFENHIRYSVSRVVFFVPSSFNGTSAILDFAIFDARFSLYFINAILINR